MLDIFPGLLIFVIFLTLIEIYKYPGFIQKHFFISLDLIWNITIFLGWIVILPVLILSTKLKKNIINDKSYQKIFKLNICFLPIVATLAVALNNIESQYGTGYVFSILHIHPQGLYTVMILSLFLFYFKLLLSSKEFNTKS